MPYWSITEKKRLQRNLFMSDWMISDLAAGISIKQNNYFANCNI